MVSYYCVASPPKPTLPFFFMMLRLGACNFCSARLFLMASSVHRGARGEGWQVLSTGGARGGARLPACFPAGVNHPDLLQERRV